MGRRIHAVLATLFLTLLLRPALAGPIFSGSQHVVSPGAQVAVQLLVEDIIRLEALTARVSFISLYLAFDPAHLTLGTNTGTYALSPNDDVVLGTLTAGFTPLLAQGASGQELLASLAGSGTPVDGSGSLLTIPILVAANAPDGDYYVDFTCYPTGGCADLDFPDTQAKITVKRQQPIPEPSVLGLLALGLTTLLCMRRF